MDPDLDLVVLDEEGRAVGNSFFSKPEVVILENQPTGNYYVVVSKFEEDMMADAAAVPYTLTVAEPECDDDFDCDVAATPICGNARTCVAAPDNECVDGDGMPELGDLDDGPAAATPLGAVAIDDQICNPGSGEADYYSFTVTNGQNAEITLSYDAGGGAADLDINVLDSEGTPVGFTFWNNPEVVSLSFLPAGTYYVRVSYFSQGAQPVYQTYTISAAIDSAGGGCDTASDCAVEHSTQIFRGSCNSTTGACSFIDGASGLASGALCDSANDCTSGVCSYSIFQSEADTSICTINCTDSLACSAEHGPMHSCTVPYQNNFCRPDCAADLECGTNTNSPNLDTDQPWDYLTCTSGVCDLTPSAP